MFTLSYLGAAASTVSGGHATHATPDKSTGKTTAPTVLSGSVADHPPGPQRHREQIRHLLFGTPSGVQTTIQQLHQLGYAEPNDWSRPISTDRPNEVMAVLTKRVNAV
ncbi:MAG: hypothetical protein WBG63_14580 [Phormidesmis sp.]